jgi:hypothetical protein
MDQLRKEFKGDLAANRQFKNIDEAVDYAHQWILRPANNQPLQKAGIFSKMRRRSRSRSRLIEIYPALVTVT